MTNPQVGTLSTIELGRLVGYSTQQIRDLERLGVLPSAPRAANGYRRYGEPHLLAARAYRALAAAVGPVPARRLAPALRLATTVDAAAMIDDLHAAIANERLRVSEALRGLAAVVADDAASFDPADRMSIGELAGALDVRPSALRHWEDEDLIHPERSDGSHARSYGARAIAEARIVAALRAGGYPLPPIARVLDQVRAYGATVEAQEILDRRLHDLGRRSIALLAAAADLHALLTQHPPADG